MLMQDKGKTKRIVYALLRACMALTLIVVLAQVIPLGAFAEDVPWGFLQEHSATDEQEASDAEASADVEVAAPALTTPTERPLLLPTEDDPAAGLAAAEPAVTATGPAEDASPLKPREDKGTLTITDVDDTNNDGTLSQQEAAAALAAATIDAVLDTYTLAFDTTAVTAIGDDAFQDNVGLTAVTFPATLATLGSVAFQGCTSLTSVTFTGDNPPTTFGASVFAQAPVGLKFYVPPASKAAYQAVLTPAATGLVTGDYEVLDIPDTTPPTVTGTAPLGDSVAPMTTLPQLVLTFSETVAQVEGKTLAIVTNSTTYLYTIPSAAVTPLVSGEGTACTATIPFGGFVPALSLSYGTTYTLTANAGAFADTAGNPTTVISASFTTVQPPQPTLSLSVTALDLGTVTTAATSSPQNVSVSSGNLTAPITYQLSGDTSAFTVGTLALNAAAGTFTVTFTPASARTYNAVLTFSSAGAEDKAVTLSGTGRAPSSNSGSGSSSGGKDGTGTWYPSTQTPPVTPPTSNSTADDTDDATDADDAATTKPDDTTNPGGTTTPTPPVTPPVIDNTNDDDKGNQGDTASGKDTAAAYAVANLVSFVLGLILMALGILRWGRIPAAQRSKMTWAVALVLITIAQVVLLLIVDDFTGSALPFDGWTAPMLVLLIVEGFCFYQCNKRKPDAPKDTDGGDDGFGGGVGGSTGGFASSSFGSGNNFGSSSDEDEDEGFPVFRG